MLMHALYLAANLLCLAVLVREKYYEIWRWFVVMQALTCWQIAIISAVPLAARTTAIYLWLPGDLALLVVSAGAVMECWWRSMQGFPRPHKWGVCISLAGGMTFAGLSFRWLLPMQAYSDWFQQIKSDRLVWNLCAASLAIMAFGVCCTLCRRGNARFNRLHAFLLAVLAVGHVLFSDLTHWSHANEMYRALECCCLLGWMINVSLMRLDRRWLDAVERRDPAVTSIPPDPAQLLPAVRISLPVWQGAPGNHRWQDGVNSWQPVVPAKTR